ncbi:glucose 1-dehydrogenase [Actinoallomurus bryophytorum]|uniref:NADP-dependent 3-hydroxy acid dehydrogenase YdfG n=1 Tax=Actinoallomurus bryophytorum TaxID=1490222 RepID=A0A543CSY5_9ACTN|nr:SDR family oxidoreductase [Actinoallomurus bryophytorum]TQM00131.1 NADP-dependent 3-hydroxy acid dehydrogenase YdfG [Actinoallomurus bryophytorum]
MGTLDGKVAVITGATSGIGAAVARLFVAEGAWVVIGGRREEMGEALARELGGPASFRRTDVTVEADVEALVGHAVDEYGRLDVMVNSAGGPGHWEGVADIDLEVFQSVLSAHLGGVVLGTKYAARAMVPRRSGTIINLASTSGHLAGWCGPDHSTAKAAVLHFTRCAAVELGERGIRVNSVSPGVVPSGVCDYQPIRRTGTAEDVAAAALWLAGDATGLANGHDLALDEGISAGRSGSVSVSRAECAGLTTASGRARP